MAIEDILVIFHDYFDQHKKPSISDFDKWLSVGSRRNTYYFIKKGVLNPDLTFKERRSSVLRLIRKPWDGKWRFVVFDIPEKERNFRDVVRRRLKELDFKQLQRSVWFSPLPLRKMIKKIDKRIDDYDYLTVIEGKIYRDDPKRIVRNKWDISTWVKKAQRWISKVENKQELDERNQNIFWELVLDHPKVPLDLLPRNWPLEEIVNLFTSKKVV